MNTQIQCPNCGTPFLTEVQQIIDVGREPQLKELLLTNQLNVAVCPSCGAGGPLMTPMAYHDPAHDLFMVFVPMEMNLPQMEREQLIGRMTQQLMNNVPQEERRGYLLQPQVVINQQTMMEKVLETEGVTPEMLARQRNQAELLRSLSNTSDRGLIDQLLLDRADLVDETFFAILRQTMEMAEKAPDQEPQVLRLINLQARLYRETAVGQMLEQRQIAVREFSRDAQENGLSPELLVRHVVDNIAASDTALAIAMAGQQALGYEFFAGLTSKADAARKAGQADAAVATEKLRDELLAAQREAQAAGEKMLQQAERLLNKILAAPQIERAVRENLNDIDEMFLELVEARLHQARETGDTQQALRLEQIRMALQQEVERSLPPEVRFINQLLQAPTDEDASRLLGENAPLVTPNLIRMLEAVEGQVATQQPELQGRLDHLKSLVAQRI